MRDLRSPLNRPLQLGDLVEAELDRSLTLEQRDEHEHDEFAALRLDLADRPRQARKRAFLDRDGLADLEVDLGRERSMSCVATYVKALVATTSRRQQKVRERTELDVVPRDRSISRGYRVDQDPTPRATAAT